MSESKELAFNVLISGVLLSVIIFTWYIGISALTSEASMQWLNEVPF